MADSLFEPDGEHFVPTEMARGPWSPDALHGGPPAALLAGAIEGHEASGHEVVRLTVEIMRPVPVAPLTVDVRTVRPGKKVQLVEAIMRAGDVELCRATGLRIRRADVEMPTYLAPPTAPPVFPDLGPPASQRNEWTAFHNSGVEMRYAVGGFETMGPAAVWIRLLHPVLPGVSLSPVQRAVAAADFGNGVSATLEFERYLFINPDLTVYLHRPPVGEWICLDAVTRPETSGIGLAHSALFDRDGEIGRSLQSLLIDRR